MFHHASISRFKKSAIRNIKNKLCKQITEICDGMFCRRMEKTAWATDRTLTLVASSGKVWQVVFVPQQRVSSEENLKNICDSVKFWNSTVTIFNTWTTMFCSKSVPAEFLHGVAKSVYWKCLRQEYPTRVSQKMVLPRASNKNIFKIVAVARIQMQEFGHARIFAKVTVISLDPANPHGLQVSWHRYKKRWFNLMTSNRPIFANALHKRVRELGSLDVFLGPSRRCSCLFAEVDISGVGTTGNDKVQANLHVCKALISSFTQFFPVKCQITLCHWRIEFGLTCRSFQTPWFWMWEHCYLVGLDTLGKPPSIVPCCNLVNFNPSKVEIMLFSSGLRNSLMIIR